jgi:hypothetical protein
MQDSTDPDLYPLKSWFLYRLKQGLVSSQNLQQLIKLGSEDDLSTPVDLPRLRCFTWIEREILAPARGCDPLSVDLRT